MRFTRSQRKPGGLTGRALVLGAVVVLLALVLASPMQRYLQQRNAMAASERQHASSSARVAELQAQKDRWNDPAYVEAQARARLQYARPGDTVYVVVDPKRAVVDPSADQSAPVTTQAGPQTWQQKAWTSLQVADR